ncbi:putative membrane protein [Bradyrhizobium sp. AZCC 1588]|uniref:hypothetical protein n=1 Tax=unclassified Bradyrhizobium TaxID=2631580 RepID=UPI002FF14E7E
MFAIDAAARRTAAITVTAGQMLRSNLTSSGTFLVGSLAGAGLTVQVHQWWISYLNLCLSSTVGLRHVNDAQPDLVLAFTLYPVTTSAGQIAVLAVAVAVLIGFLLWTKRAMSASFFLGALAGTGFVLSFDIVWVHWIFGLHHITNTQMDLVLEPLFVLLGLAFLWFAMTRERRHTPSSAAQPK